MTRPRCDHSDTAETAAEAVETAVATATPALDALDLEQALLEAEATFEARLAALADRDAARAKSRESLSAPGRRLIGRHAEALAEALQAYLAAQVGKSGRPAVAAERLAPIAPRVAAALALRAAIDGLSEPRGLTAVAMRIGAAIEEEARWGRLRDAEAAKLAALARRAGRAAAPAGRVRALAAGRARIEAAGPGAWTPWPARERELVGLRLLDLAIDATGLFEIGERVEAGKTRKTLGPSAAALAALEALDPRDLRPLRQPMVAPPRPWTTPYDGGWLTMQTPRAALVKTRRSEALDGLDAAAAPGLFAAVNAAQATAWQVNADVLDVVECFEAAGLAAPGLPSAEPLAEPGLERARRARRLDALRAIATARRFRDHAALWFPVELDFRGRLYYAPTVDPQGPDLTRALFRFAQAKPLGPEGWKWLAIHLCNCGDFGKMSKAPLAARAEWTLANEERILTVAADPLADDWWTEADAPWRFLAACREWAGFCEQGEEFGSRLPIALDGSCSGIQHFSLALRDETGGAAVNLAPRAPDARAADIYEEVAERTRALLEEDLASDAVAHGRPVAELARAWLAFGVDRAVCKRPTMTYGYGARGYGFARMLIEDTLRPAKLARPEAWPFADDGFAAALHLSARMTEAIERVVLKAAETMRWLQRAASLAAEAGRALAWTTPDGLRVSQDYPATAERRVKTALGASLVKLTLREPTGGVDKRLSRQGAAPNYVHSLDACHLRMTVAKAAAEGIDAFALVHDSFGVHAADTPRFFRIVREAMVEMYDRVDVIEAFRREVAADLSDAFGPDAEARLGPAPAKGALALEGVLDSEHCFA